MKSNGKIVLVGAPNVGKSTLFNALTNSNKKVGNYSGTTVTCSKGYFKSKFKNIEVLDVPGLSSLYSIEGSAPTDTLVSDLLVNEKYDVLVNIIDASNLHNNLLITCQLLDLAVPTVVILNVDNNNTNLVDHTKLELYLGCKVLKYNLKKLKINKASTKTKLQNILSNKLFRKPSLNQDIESITNGKQLIKSILDNKKYLPSPKIFYGLQLESKLKQVNNRKDRFDLIKEAYHSLNIYEKVSIFVSRLVKYCSKVEPPSKGFNLNKALDSVLLNRFLGLPIFLIIMYIVFYIIINSGLAFQGFFDSLAKTFVVDLPGDIFNKYHLDNFFTITALSVGKTLEIIASFVPFLFIFNFILGFLEGSGYMTRGAYLTDSMMRLFGLPGKSLISLIIGLGCSVPAVMSSRTINNKVERILTIVSVPFIACSARLTVFIFFTSIFFAYHATTIVYFLYFFGLVIGIFSVWFFKNTLFKNNESFFVMELPKYRLPKLSYLLKNSWQQVRLFCTKRTFKVMIPMVIIFNILHYSSSNIPEIKNSNALHNLQKVQVLFAPMGIEYNNWEATVSLLGGAIAKETVITSLNSLYLLNTKTQTKTSSNFALKQELKDNFFELKQILPNIFNMFNFTATFSSSNNNLGKIISHKFGSVSAGLSYLIFILLYTPCLVSLLAVKKEIGKKWMYFINTWSILMAYIFASSCYQIFNFSINPMFSSIWLLSCISFFFIAFFVLKKWKVLQPSI